MGLRGAIRRGALGWAALTLALLLLSPLFGNPSAGEQEERRVQVGLKLFPSVLAADQDILAKADPDGRLPVLLVYRDDRELAERLAKGLAEIEAVRKRPLRIEPVAAERLGDFAGQRIAGLFLAERLYQGFDAVAADARRHHALLFSPFDGDIERGAAAGMTVSDRILPRVNMAALKAAGIELKSFFLRIAERYE